MAKKLFGTKLFATALATFALASCQSETTLLEPAADNMRDVRLTVTVSKGEQTRTNLDLSADQKSILMTWNLGDLIQVSEEDGRYAGTLKVTEFANEEHTLAKFVGDIRVLDKDGIHKLTFSYLGKDAQYKATKGREMPDMIYDFTSQTNTGVNALAANDLLIAKGDVNVVKGNAEFKSLYMERQFAYGRFTLLYNDQPLAFDGNTVVTISNENGDLKTGVTLDFPSGLSTSDGSISLATSVNDFYVTFVPGSLESKFKFNVTIGEDVYEGYSNSYLVEKNDFYRKAQGLTKGEALPINVRKTDGSDDEHSFSLTYNANYGKNDTWTDNQKGVGLSFTYTLSEYDNIFEETNEGYTFTGWNTQADGTGETLVPNATLSVTYPDGTATVYAQWKKNEYDWTVTWSNGYDDNAIKSKTYHGEDGLSIVNEYPSDPTREGYEFKGWDKNIDKLSKDELEVVITALWEETKYDYTLIFEYISSADNTTYVELGRKEIKGVDGLTVTLSQYDTDAKAAFPYKENWIGWDAIDDNKVKEQTAVTFDKDNKTITAVAMCEWVVKFVDELDASVYGTAIGYNYAASWNWIQSLPDNPTKDGYEFLGWYYNDKKVTSASQIVVTRDNFAPQVIAKWKKDSSGTVIAPGAVGTGY